MDGREHFLTCLGEEANEVAQRVSKALRFGMREVQTGQERTNTDRLMDELRDLVCVAKILEDLGYLPALYVKPEMVAAKREKIERYMEISRAQGVLIAQQEADND